jgi:hypothetical protein
VNDPGLKGSEVASRGLFRGESSLLVTETAPSGSGEPAIPSFDPFLFTASDQTTTTDLAAVVVGAEFRGAVTYSDAQHGTDRRRRITSHGGA